MNKFLIDFAMLFLCMACNNSAENKTAAGITPADSLLNKVETSNSFASITDSSKLIILKRDSSQLSYPEYKKQFEADSEFSKPGFSHIDIDGDGNNEIVVNHYTGGAHCCDVNTILTRAGNNEMKEVLNYTGGTSISKDTVSLSFFEALGYFHTCYACGIEYPKSVYPAVSVKFLNEKFYYLPVNDTVNKNILYNLDFIKIRGIPDKDSDGADGFDDGTRKAIAFNLVAYYYNNGRDINKTRNVFDNYYAHKDKEIIWKNVAEYISGFDNNIKKAVLL